MENMKIMVRFESGATAYISVKVYAGITIDESIAATFDDVAAYLDPDSMTWKDVTFDSVKAVKHIAKIESGKETKKEVYARFNIEYKAGKILSPIGFINPLLVNGNSKIGDGVYHYSMLAGKREYKANINGDIVSVFGTCGDDCFGCYGMTGNYNYQSVIDSLAIKTVLAREYLGFVERAIMAQIKADNIKTIRIHATGDFFSREYLAMWERIIAANPNVVFWSYTKEYAAETAFDKYENANIVKSMIPGATYNYGKAEYVIAVYNLLKDMGKEVYVCRCGIDKNQHCTNCKACALCEHVLFLEHGTKYNAKKDPAFPAFVQLVESQGNKYLN